MVELTLFLIIESTHSKIKRTGNPSFRLFPLLFWSVPDCPSVCAVKKINLLSDALKCLFSHLISPWPAAHSLCQRWDDPRREPRLVKLTCRQSLEGWRGRKLSRMRSAVRLCGRSVWGFLQRSAEGSLTVGSAYRPDNQKRLTLFWLKGVWRNWKYNLMSFGILWWKWWWIIGRNMKIALIM